MTAPNWKNRTLFHGDNLEFLRSMNSESVDLIATDPPFNKGKDFHATPDSLAAGAKFQDRWSWEKDVHEEWTDQIKDDHPKLLEAIESARYAHSDGMGAYVCFMAVRLLAMRRVLKPTGSIYLHCDPTASHYLKAVMDAIFGWRNFRNEIIWGYKTGGVPRESGRFARKHDVVLFYCKNEKTVEFNQFKEISYTRTLPEPHTASGRRLGVGRDEFGKFRHVAMRDWWVEYGINSEADITPLYRNNTERVGWPTQKPLALYERIVKASSNEGDFVLDPFAGCATTCVAAERLGRQWAGIDIWEEAHEVVLDRLKREVGLFGDVTFTDRLPERTDEGETASVALETINRRQLAAWQKLSHKQMVEILTKAQADSGNPQLVVCAGCGRRLEPEFMELDHLTPKSEPHSTNDLSNRILLCRPCNGRKSDRHAMKGLWRENGKVGWMTDRTLAENALKQAYNAYRREERRSE
ncbi:MAG: DNA methyltransferase [Gammaproteobacteria bacterium]|nr:DNA methyltransferase [Gammaproteobacteria bacterium]